MPIHTCTDGQGRSGFRFGDRGTCYTGPGAWTRALQQGRAIKVRQRAARIAAATSFGEEALGEGTTEGPVVGFGPRRTTPGAFQRSTKVQSLLFPVEQYTEREVRLWVEDHNFAMPAEGPERKGRGAYWRVRQFDPEHAEPGTFRTIPFRGTRGIKAIIGVPKAKGFGGAERCDTGFG